MIEHVRDGRYAFLIRFIDEDAIAVVRAVGVRQTADLATFSVATAVRPQTQTGKFGAMRMHIGLFLTALVLASCSTTPATSVAPLSISLSPSATTVESPSHAPASSEPDASPPPTTPASTTASSFGAAVFADPDDCVNPVGGYRVAYPDDWYSNAVVENPFDPAGDGIAACGSFAPRDFATVYGTEPSPAVAISMGVTELPDGVPWNYGPFEGYAILSDVPATIAGYPARVQEVEVTLPNPGFVVVGDRSTTYIIELGDNRYLYARTTNSKDYPASQQVLADMMRTLELVSP